MLAHISNIEAMLAYAKAVCAAAAANRKSGPAIKFFAAIMPIIGKTIEEAKAKHVAALKNISVEDSLAKFSRYANVDMSQFPMDGPFNSSTLKVCYKPSIPGKMRVSN